jgi:hypothetical protein
MTQALASSFQGRYIGTSQRGVLEYWITVVEEYCRNEMYIYAVSFMHNNQRNIFASVAVFKLSLLHQAIVTSSQ